MSSKNVISTVSVTIFVLGLLVSPSLRAGDGLEAVKEQMKEPTTLAEKYLGKAKNLKFIPEAKGQEITKDECRKVALELNAHLQMFKYQLLPLHTRGKQLKSGVDFCFENAINTVRLDAFSSIYPRHIYLNTGSFTTQTGLKANRVLTLNYHVAGIEQFLIDSHNRVVQFSYQRYLLGKPTFTVQVTTALTKEGHVISKQIHLNDGKELVNTELQFSSADGLILEAGRYNYYIASTPVESFSLSTIDPSEGLKPVLTVLGALIDGSQSAVRDDRGLLGSATSYQDSNGVTAWPQRVVSYGEDKRPGKKCEKAYVVDHGNASSVGDTQCFHDLMAKVPPIVQ